MKISQYWDVDKLKTVITIEIYDYELMAIQLDKFELRLQDECNESNKVSDKLLLLETIARKLEKSTQQEVG